MDVAVSKIDPATLSRSSDGAINSVRAEVALAKQIESSGPTKVDVAAPRSEEEANELIDKVADSLKVDRYLNFLSAFLDEPERYRAFVEHLNDLKLDRQSKPAPAINGVSLKV